MLVPVSGVFSLKNVFCLTEAKTCKCWHPHSRGRCRGRDELTGWWCNTLLWWWSSLNDFFVFLRENVSVYSFCFLSSRETRAQGSFLMLLFGVSHDLWITVGSVTWSGLAHMWKFYGAKKNKPKLSNNKKNRLKTWTANIHRKLKASENISRW